MRPHKCVAQSYSLFSLLVNQILHPFNTSFGINQLESASFNILRVYPKK